MDTAPVVVGTAPVGADIGPVVVDTVPDTGFAVAAGLVDIGRLVVDIDPEPDTAAPVLIQPKSLQPMLFESASRLCAACSFFLLGVAGANQMPGASGRGLRGQYWRNGASPRDR